MAALGKTPLARPVPEFAPTRIRHDQTVVRGGAWLERLRDDSPCSGRACARIDYCAVRQHDAKPEWSAEGLSNDRQVCPHLNCYRRGRLLIEPQHLKREPVIIRANLAPCSMAGAGAWTGTLNIGTVGSERPELLFN